MFRCKAPSFLSKCLPTSHPNQTAWDEKQCTNINIIVKWGLEPPNIRCKVWGSNNNGFNNNVMDKNILLYDHCKLLSYFCQNWRLLTVKLFPSHKQLYCYTFTIIYKQITIKLQKDPSSILQFRKGQKIITIINIIGLKYQGQMQEMLIQSG